jgi:pyruvate formate lyase activating enzyme
VDPDASSRRAFLERLARLGGAAWGASLLLSSAPLRGKVLSLWIEAAGRATLADLLRDAPVARYWAPAGASCADCHAPVPKGEAAKGHRKAAPVKCLLCAHGCVLKDGERGLCRARLNVRGQMRTLTYGRPIAEHVDPIEKKPFYHFLPGVQAYSLATAGCPLRCRFCQNWEISQASPEDYGDGYVPAGALANRAREIGAPVLAFTYNEPTVFVEYFTDMAREARKHGIRSVLVSCGFMNEAPLTEMIEVLSAIKIDLKGFSEDFYRRVSGAELRPVLRSIRQVAKAGRHLEIVNLVVPTLNDSPRDLDELCRWVAGEAGPDVPLHFTRFHPDYQLLNLPPTPVATLERAREVALKHGLRYPYVGNVPGHPGNHTYCPGCGKIVIERTGFFLASKHLKDGACAFCGRAVAGVWS